MPCMCDYTEESEREDETVHVAKLLIYLYGKADKSVNNNIKNIANGKTKNLEQYCDELTHTLCEECKLLEKENWSLFNVTDVVKDKMLRNLLDWWEEHKEKDKQREKGELREKLMKFISMCDFEELKDIFENLSQDYNI